MRAATLQFWRLEGWAPQGQWVAEFPETWAVASPTDFWFLTFWVNCCLSDIPLIWWRLTSKMLWKSHSLSFLIPFSKSRMGRAPNLLAICPDSVWHREGHNIIFKEKTSCKEDRVRVERKLEEGTSKLSKPSYEMLAPPSLQNKENRSYLSPCKLFVKWWWPSCKRKENGQKEQSTWLGYMSVGWLAAITRGPFMFPSTGWAQACPGWQHFLLNGKPCVLFNKIYMLSLLGCSFNWPVTCLAECPSPGRLGIKRHVRLEMLTEIWEAHTGYRSCFWPGVCKGDLFQFQDQNAGEKWNFYI